MTSILLPTYSLWVRDLKHFIRQRSRVIGAVGQPFVIWIFLSAGFRHSVDAGSADYGTYLFPGVIMLIALFAAIFSTISVIEDRKTGFMQGVLTSPAPRASIVWSKMLAGTTIALLQSVVFMVLLPFTGLSLTWDGIGLSVLILAGTGMTLTGLGFLIAWSMSSTQGFHAIMNLLLIPMWLLSGAFFPPEGTASWLGVIIRLNPLYYVTTLFQKAFFLGSGVTVSGGPSIALSLCVFVGLFLLLFIMSLRLVRRP
ncbi:MAG: ABC transporter permease [Bacteroidota bacterium]|jgi:ABC-2 type transport system permease protein